MGVQRDDYSMCIFMELMPGTIKGLFAWLYKEEECNVMYVHTIIIADEIRQNGPLTEHVACKHTRQILEGLTYLHHLTIVHRDIKCEFVFYFSNNIQYFNFNFSHKYTTRWKR